MEERGEESEARLAQRPEAARLLELAASDG